MKNLNVILRCAVLIAFMIAMPMLALPPVADSVGSTMRQLLASNDSQFILAENVQGQTELGIYSHDSLIVPHRETSIQQVTAVEVTTPKEITSTKAEKVLALRMAEVSRRLEYWGSTDYALEQVGDDEPKYRFSCRVPLNTGSPYSKSFEAIDVDPYVAMNRVLARVESWRSVQTAKSDM